jgi:hypothetical protein
MEEFLKRVEEKINEISKVIDETSYFPGSTNFPPMAEI